MQSLFLLLALISDSVQAASFVNVQCARTFRSSNGDLLDRSSLTSTKASRPREPFFPEDQQHHHHNSGTGSSSSSSSPNSDVRFRGERSVEDAYSSLFHMSRVRQARLRREAELKARFVTGDDLHRLRLQVLTWRHELQAARKKNDRRRAQQLEGMILKAQQQDAEFIYTVSKERLVAAQQAGRFQEAEHYRRQALEARSAMPQFNLHGLWVGKYGDQGYEMINVTYVGDTLVAYKVTGGRHVPQGQVSFQANLSPHHANDHQQNRNQRAPPPPSPMEPLELPDDAARQWGCKFLQRFAGQGQVAYPGHVQSQWTDGQLVLVGQYFSFAWVPVGHQVFFGRPSAELTLRLLRESYDQATSPDDKVKEHLIRCLEETESLEEEELETHLSSSLSSSSSSTTTISSSLLTPRDDFKNFGYFE